MIDQGKRMTVRGAVFGVAILSLAGTLAGCTAGGVRGGPGMTAKPSAADFEIAVDSNLPGNEAVSVKPDDGDALLEARKNPGDKDNRIVWVANRAFGIKFVSIDDPQKPPKKKFGPRQSDGWNDATCNAAGTSCTLELRLDEGKDRKEIRAAKYIVAAPSGCSDIVPIPSACTWLDPIIIVRY